MPKSYSGDLRERVIEAVEGGASRRETAERFEVSVSSAVKWLQRWHESKSAAPKPRGGSISPLEEFDKISLRRGWRNDRVPMFRRGGLGLTIQVEDLA
jgi:transposase